MGYGMQKVCSRGESKRNDEATEKLASGDKVKERTDMMNGLFIRW